MKHRSIIDSKRVSVSQELVLPNGMVIPNRIVKAPMTERIAKSDHIPHSGHLNLYSEWAKGGAGLIVTGNVMVDRTYLEAPGNLVLDETQSLDAFKELATKVKSFGASILDAAKSSWPTITQKLNSGACCTFTGSRKET